MDRSPYWKLIPSNEQLLEPVYNAIIELGGSGTNKEIYDHVRKSLNLPEEAVNILHKGHTVKTELQYRIEWARTMLKQKGLINNNTKRGVWTIISTTENAETLIDNDSNYNESFEEDVEIEGAEKWREELSETLMNMNPYAFETLTQRLLRECGFDSVHVTKKSGDGGIDGFGKLKVNGIFCFNVAFQCKRYKGSVGSSEIRDFRGSLSKSMEKGVFITTGTFTESAVREAEDPGKQQIDLIDGSTLIEMMKDLKIGVVETYAVDKKYFEELNKKV